MLSPLKAVRKYCLWCCGEQPEEVKLCPSVDCPLYKLRFGRKQKDFKYSVLKAIKDRCYDCSAFDWKEVRECKFEDCWLYRFRRGKNPNRKGIGNKGIKEYAPEKKGQKSVHEQGVLV